MSNQKTALLLFAVAYLAQENKEENYDKACKTLLQLNSNRTLNQNLSRRKNIDKLVYELQKQVDFNQELIAKAQDAEYVTMSETCEKTVIPFVEEIASKEVEEVEKGKRADHDTLPIEVQAIYESQRGLYMQLSNAHSRLKAMEDKAPCDRLPFIKILIDFKAKIDANWAEYDAFGKVAEIKEEQKLVSAAPAQGNPIVLTAMRIGANRKYITDNKPKLVELKESNPKKYEELFDKVQARITEQVNGGVGIDPATIDELKAMGFNLDKTQVLTGDGSGEALPPVEQTSEGTQEGAAVSTENAPAETNAPDA